MKKLLPAYLIACTLCGAVLADTIWTETFETDGQGTRYTTTTPEFSDGSEDFYTRTDGSNIGSSIDVGTPEGSYWFGMMDVDGEGASATQTITFTNVNISGKSSLVFKVLLAEDDASDAAEDWDSSDYAHFQYKIDSDDWQELLWVEAISDGTNFEPAIDTDQNGTGNSPSITDVFTEFSASITGTGNTLTIRCATSFNSGDEDIAMDNLRLEGTSSGGGNTAPTLNPIGNKSLIVSNALNFAVTATDIDNDPIVLSVSNLPPGAVFNTVTNAGSVSNSFSWAIAAPTGTYTTTFYAYDGTTNDSESITITVTNIPVIADLPPVLDPIGDKEVFELDALSFTVTASDPIDSDPITLTATNLPAGATFTNGVFTWSNAAPAGAYDVTFAATDKDGSDSETITITVTGEPILLISEIADPFGTGAGDYRFVELYNAGSSTIDLADGNWYLCRHNNGESWYRVSLTGIIPAGETYVIGGSDSSFFEAYGFYPNQSDTTVDGGNGDDSYSLYYNGDYSSGTLIDIYGERDIDGTGEAWEYTDGRAERNSNILEPNTTWTASEWTITSGATTNDMTPGVHGPAPEFQGLEYPFVFLGDDLNLVVTAVNTVKTDTITLSSTNLPGEATFPTVTGTNAVSSLLSWAAPAAGVYTATLAAEGLAGTTIKSITITVAATDEIDGWFYRWDPDTIVKLDNGQFWQNIGGQGENLSSSLRDPEVTVTKFGGKYRMTVVGVPSDTTVEQIEVEESGLESEHAELGYGTVYELDDGTFWKQISFDSDSFIPEPRTVWHWTEDGKTYLRFRDRNDVDLGTCQVTASDAPTGGPIVTEIDGYFRGWKNQRVFALANGEFWQQTVADSSVDTLYRPIATLTNWLSTGTWRLYVDGASAPGYVNVQQLTDVTRTEIDGGFHGFGNGEFFLLRNGELWRQTSIETSTSTRSNPDVLIWDNTLEMPDEGRSISVEQLTVTANSSITNDFSGLHYGNLYQLANGQNRSQVSFENILDFTDEPDAILWTDEGQAQLLLRAADDSTIGSCTVIDADADDDGDQVANAAELIAGTAIDDAGDLFLITNIAYDGEGRAVLSWNAVSGRIYTVEWTQSLNEEFQPLETDAAPDWTDVYNAPETDGFYRIRVQLAD